MVDVLLIPDGAAEPRRNGPTSLERAHTPHLDALAAAGATRLVATTPPGLPAGSETGIPTLLGARLDAPTDRGAIEAAAHGILMGAGERARRVDAPRGAGDVSAQLAELLPGHRVVHLRGHRHLAIGPPGPLLPPSAVNGRSASSTGLDRTFVAGRTPGWRVWAVGAALPQTLDAATVVVAAPGAAAGIGRLMGATVVTPAGATGGVDTDLRAKRRAALAALDTGATRVVVHVGAPDEAAHDRDLAAKVAALEAIDAELVGPLWDAVRQAGGTLTVCPDHGTDPKTGEHDGAPVPAVSATSGVPRHTPVTGWSRLTAGGAVNLDHPRSARGLGQARTGVTA